MHIVLQKHETTDDKLATGLLLGLWVGEVLAAAEYWLLKSGSSCLAAFGWAFRRRAVVSLTFALGCLGFLWMGVSKKLSTARELTALLDEKAISNGAALYRAASGQWPLTLEQLVPSYLKDLHRDPWDRNYAFYRGEGGIAVVSAGADGDLGSPDDVTYVTPNKAVTCPPGCASVIGPHDVSERLGSPQIAFDVAAGGLRLAELGPGGLGRAGLQQNDVILRVNGFSLATPDGALEAYNQLRDANWFEIALVRDGQPVHLSIDRASVERTLPQP